MKLLLISARSYGDCIISIELLHYLSLDKTIQIDIVTKPQFVVFFKPMKIVNHIFTADFPMGAHAKFDFLTLLRLIKKIFFIRKNHYDVILNNMGDFRENFIGFLLKTKFNVAPKISKNHPFFHHIRQGCHQCVNRKMVIPDHIVNIYEMQKKIAEMLLLREFPPIKRRDNLTRRRIGIHPIASVLVRMWKYPRWIEVITSLYKDEKIFVFCTILEKTLMENIFESVADKVEIISEDIAGFFEKLKEVYLFIGLDSFSIHAAYFTNIPHRILLNGANESKIWAPPETHVISGGMFCSYYPCYNKPKCIGKDFEYICMDAIQSTDVIKKAKELMNE